MQCFIGIVPPSSISEAIQTIQRQYGDNRTEPHITLRPPVVLADPASWMEALKETAISFNRFPVVLTRTGMFGKRVLFIEAEATELYTLEGKLLPAVKPFEQPGRHKDQPFHAHLTLGRLNVGFTPAALKEMRKLADDILLAPVTFTAEFIRVYHKPSINERYKVYEDVYFNP
jgi:2'-5' RNA ligase